MRTEPAPAEAGTRRAILDALKRDGPQDAATLAAQLGVTAMAVRQHLYALQAERLVGHEKAPRPIGRPAKLWRLTAAADRLFPDAHAALTVALLESMQTALGEDGMQRLLRTRADSMVAEYRARLNGRRSLNGKLAVLAKLRTEEGYMADVARAEDGAYMLLENHCPICVAATRCQGLCQVEQEVFQRVLGDDVQVERVEHILAGARRCAYRVRPR